MSPALDVAFIRSRFAELETAILLELWRRDERMPPAEAALRAELLTRGLSEAELDELVARRAEFAAAIQMSERETIAEYGLLGRFVMGFLAIALGTLLSNLFGLRVALLAVASLFLIYVVVMVRRIFSQLLYGGSTVGALFMGYMLIEVLALGVVGGTMLYFVLSGRIQ